MWQGSLLPPYVCAFVNLTSSNCPTSVIVSVRTYCARCSAAVKWNACDCLTGHERCGAATSCVSENTPRGRSQMRKRDKLNGLKQKCEVWGIRAHFADFETHVQALQTWRTQTGRAAILLCVCVRQGKDVSLSLMTASIMSSSTHHCFSTVIRATSLEAEKRLLNVA